MPAWLKTIPNKKTVATVKNSEYEETANFLKK